MKRRIGGILFLTYCFITISAVHAAEPACAGRPYLKGKCFIAEGKLYVGNGTPSARIRLGTHRTLGVEPYFEGGTETFNAPQPIRDGVTFDHSLTGKFLVCPLSSPLPHTMQDVCIVSYKSKSNRDVSAPKHTPY